MINRKDIRTEIKRELQDKLKINRFSARTSALEPVEFPLALIYFPDEKVIDDKEIYTERELELRVEVGIIPKADPEDEIYSLSDELEAALLGSERLTRLFRKIDLFSIHFVVEGEGEDLVSAAQHVYKINYLAPRAGIVAQMKPAM